MNGPGSRTERAIMAGATGAIEGPPPSEAAPLPEGPSRQGDRLRGQVVVLLPALNEEGAIGDVIDRIPREGLRSLGYDVAVWVVDGQSTDATMDIARGRGATTFTQTGAGKGNAMRQAFTRLLSRPWTTGRPENRFFVMLDADGTYPPEEIPHFVEALEAGGDVILGSRLRGSIADGAISGLNLAGNRLLSALASLLFRVPVTDVCTGMWGFREDALRRFGLVAKGFDLEADLFASACQRRARVREVPISYGCRVGEAKLVPLRTGVVIAWRLLARRFRRSRTDPRPTLPASKAMREETS